MVVTVPDSLVDFAQELAGASGEIIRRYFRTPIGVDDKPDQTPVTIADREVERAMRRLIAARFPAHGVIGEEEGAERGDADLVWVLDPIDGTKAFLTGKPTFGTLIGLMIEGAPVLGIIDQPVLRERWLGVRGAATKFNGAAVRARRCDALAKALLNATTPEMFTGANRAAFDRLCRAVRFALYGGDCYAYGLLASGFIDLVVEAGLKPHDFCPLVPIIEGAGGAITDWRGARLTLGSDGRVVAGGDPKAHAQALAALAP